MCVLQTEAPRAILCNDREKGGMADDDDDETAADDAYDLSSVRRERREEVITMPVSSAAVAQPSSEPAPDCERHAHEPPPNASAPLSF